MTYSWKLYRKRLNEGFLDAKARESLFVLGLDLGNHSSSLAFYDINRNMPEVIDVSGGYGKPSMPTALQYVRESREWVFGEYALLNRGTTSDTIYTGLLEKLPKKEYLDVDGKPVATEQVMGTYLREFLANCRNINPKAEFAGITLSVPGYTSDESKEAILQVFKLSGYEKPLISMDSDRECIFSWYFHRKPPKAEKVALLDFGSRELRGGLYDIVPGKNGEPALIRCCSSLFDKSCGTDVVDSHVTRFLTDFYLSETNTPANRLDPRIASQIQAFAYQHKDLLFQQASGSRPVKLYYNFVYPPIVCSVTEKIMTDFLSPHRERFTDFLNRLFKKSITDSNLSKDDIDAVICTGGGFEMLWARNLAAEFFSGAEILVGKNPKSAAASGASVRSAQALGITEAVPFHIEDSHMLKVDIGVSVRTKSQNHKRERFFPIAENGSFWWQEREPVTFIYGGETGEAENSGGISFFSRNAEGEQSELGIISLDGLPKRPAGTTRLNLGLTFTQPGRITATLRDVGFGELFPTADFERRVELVI